MIQMMRYLLGFLPFLLAVQTTHAQITGTIAVNGNLDYFYPVTFYDGGWDNNAATELEIGRSYTHQDANWRGALIARFRFHVNNYGNLAHFIDADIRQGNNNNPTYNKFIAGWKD